MIENDEILTKKKFSKMVMNKINQHDCTVIDAIIHICEQKNIDPGDTKKLIDPTIKGMIEREALDLNMIAGSKAKLDEFLSQ